MRRIFIQAYCGYPHGGALANYIENLTKVIAYAGYEAVLITDISKEYANCSCTDCSPFTYVKPVMPDEDREILSRQRKTGYCRERMGALEEFGITGTDRVIVLGLRNEFFLNKLFAYRDEVGFKVICGVLELFTGEHYESQIQYQEYLHIRDVVYLRSDAILTVSSYIEQYYIKKGMKVYLIPPVIDFLEYDMRPKEMDKYRFIIPSGKDSMQAMIQAFCGLNGDEIDRLELHLCMVKEETLRELAGGSEWKKLMRFTVVHEWMSYEELKHLYQKMHFLLIARDVSQRTAANFPSKVPECMAFGIVPVVSDIGDYTRYYLSNGKDSLFLKSDSTEEIRRAVRQALSMKDQEYKRYSENARIKARERFDCHLWTAEIQKMFKS